jgi:hypothetical protein
MSIDGLGLKDRFHTSYRHPRKKRRLEIQEKLINTVELCAGYNREKRPKKAQTASTDHYKQPARRDGKLIRIGSKQLIDSAKDHSTTTNCQKQYRETPLSGDE